ncbi:hypothetical protein AMECASPLE_024315, partial [Ameca splendens]
SSGEEHKNPTLQCLSVNLQWLPPVPSFCIQSAYAENPDPLFARELHGLSSQLAAFWLQDSSDFLRIYLAHSPLCSPPRSPTWCHLSDRIAWTVHLPDTLLEFPSIFLPTPGRSQSHHLGEFLVLQHSKFFIINLLNRSCFLSLFLHVGQSS